MGARCCTERKKAREFGLEYKVDDALQERATMKEDEALDCIAALRNFTGEDGVVIGIIGDAAVESFETKLYLEAIGDQLAIDLQGRVCFLTCGHGTATGAQAIFSIACREADETSVFKMEPRGRQDPEAEPEAQTLVAGDDLDWTLHLYSQICDVYITAGGDDLVTEAAMSCAYWGGVILPLICTGGASSGEHHFPADLLQAPSVVTQAQWAELSREGASPARLATSVADIVETLIDARQEAAALHKKHEARRSHLDDAGLTAAAAKPPKSFDRDTVVTHEEAKVMEDLDFESIIGNWKPTGGRNGGRIIGNLDESSLGVPMGGGEQKENEAPAGPPPEAADAAQERILSKTRMEVPAASSPIEDHGSHLEEITEMRKRMEAKLEALGNKTTKASTKLQAVFRGRVARKAVLQLKEQLASDAIAAFRAGR